MRQLRLGIDLDGVIADFNAGWMDRYNRQFERDLHPSQMTAWEAVPDLTHFGDMEAFWAWAREGPASVFRDLPLHEGAVDTLRRLAHRHRVVIVSSKFDWAIPDTLQWIAEHRIPTREIHFVWDKAAVACDVYLEDAPHNLRALVTRRREALVCRMVRPWNRPQPGALDVHDWEGFAAVVAAAGGERGRQAAGGGDER
jgi:5'(3')-deoxyribonucleotidase